MSSIKLKHSGGNSVSLNPPTAAPAPPSGTELALKLPSTYGSSGQFMKTDGAGNLSFDSVPVPTLNSLSGTISQSQLATGVGGKVIQCTYKQWNTVTSTSSTTLEEIDSTLRMTFTPILNNSLIVYSGFIYIGAGYNVVMTLELMKSSNTDMSSPSIVYEHRTDITLSNNNGNVQEYTGSTGMVTAPLRVMEISGNTTARTYSPFWQTTSGTIYQNAYNADGSYVGTSSIIIQEIVV